MSDEKNFEDGIKQVSFLWLGMLLPAFVYVVLVPLGLLQDVKAGGDDQDSLGFVLGAVALLLVVLGVWARTKMFGVATKSIPAEAKAKIVSAYLTANLLSYALFDAVGIIAILIYILAGSEAWFYLLCTAAILGLLWARPSVADLEEQAAKLPRI